MAAAIKDQCPVAESWERSIHHSCLHNFVGIQLITVVCMKDSVYQEQRNQLYLAGKTPFKRHHGLYTLPERISMPYACRYNNQKYVPFIQRKLVMYGYGTAAAGG